MTILSFDYGTSRIGVAVSQNGNAQPLVTLSAKDPWPDIASIALEYQPKELVVGLPRNLNGEPTAQTKLALSFADSLAQLTQLPVSLQDEALSSQRAIERIGKKTSIAQRKKILDQVAAQIILEDYLAWTHPNQLLPIRHQRRLLLT